MSHLIEAWGGPVFKTRDDDDTIDRLSHRGTMMVLVLFAIIVTGSQFLYGNPIVCWVPAHFTDSHESYTNQYCWVRNTYYLPLEEYIPKDYEAEKRDMVPYYQWVPIILLMQALLFCLPCEIWRAMNDRSGIELGDVMEKGQALRILEEGGEERAREKVLNNVATQFSRYVTSQRREKSGNCTLSLKHLFSRTCCKCCGRRFGNYLYSLYMVCKILYVINAIGQLFLLNAFLDMDFHTYGIRIMELMVNGTRQEISPTFPRVTMCDFKLRRLGNVQRYTVQCALPINLFNEKIFLVLYFWLLLLALMTLYSFFVWLFRVTPPKARYNFIKRKLKSKLMSLKVELDEDFKKDVHNFTENYLHPDGVFILRLIGANTDLLSGEDVVHRMWEKYQESKQDKKLYPELPVAEL